MKGLALGLGLLGVLAGTAASIPRKRVTTVVVTGDLFGHLQPCGCSSPQLGGITRQATLIRDLKRDSDVVLLANGALVASTSPQERLKLDTLAQSLGSLGVAAINLSPEDARLGAGGILTLENLTGRKLICGNLVPGGSLNLESTLEAQDLLIGGVSSETSWVGRSLGRTPIATEEAIQQVVSEARDRSEEPVLLVNGNEQYATKIATEHPELKLIVFRSTSDIPNKPVRVGQSLLVTPGEFGKSVVELTFDGHDFTEYQAVALEPSIVDDPDVEKMYKTYLSDVDKQGFIDKTPRHKTAAFAGTLTCAKCHTTDYKIWQHTKHAQAFSDLEKVNHQRDPDCVSCHVIGLDSTAGFRSRKATPDLANVGCESCHGAGASHSRSPRTIKMKKIGTAFCGSCHTPDQSPNFIPLTGWRVIQHR